MHRVRWSLLGGRLVLFGGFEGEGDAFMQRVRDGYLALAADHPDRFHVIDATQDPEEVTAQAVAALRERLG